MKRHLILLSVMVLLLLPACRTHVEPELPYSRQLRDVLGQARQSTHIMGVSAAIIVPGYQPWLGVSGESYPDHPISEDMLFDTASAGKVLMAALVMDLAEDGLLSLDDPIRQYLPPYPNVDGSITIRQLLNHTNGLYDMVSHPDGPFRKPYRQIEFDKWWKIGRASCRERV